MLWLRNIPIAHRGLHDKNTPENSLSAFKKAIEAGYAIEIDVHLSSDGELMVFHDFNLKRMTGVDEDITSVSAEFSKSLKLFGSDETIPTFDEVLALIDTKVPLLIEIKNEKAVGALESKLNEVLQNYKGEFAVQAFNPFVLAWFAKNAPQITRGQLSGRFEDTTLPFYKKFLLGNLLLNGVSKPHFIAYESQHLPNLAVSFAKLLKKPILAWTVKSQENSEYALRHADNIIFEAIQPTIIYKSMT
jgi:glycerophosphoryl diester phosphodiesterase